MKIWPMFALCAALNGACVGLELSSDEKDFGNVMFNGGLTLLWGGLAYGFYREDEANKPDKKKDKDKTDFDRFDLK